MRCPRKPQHVPGQSPSGNLLSPRIGSRGAFKWLKARARTSAGMTVARAVPSFRTAALLPELSTPHLDEPKRWDALLEPAPHGRSAAHELPG